LCVIPDEESTTLMRRRLTIAEREELVAERARRQQELLDEAATLRRSIAERAQACARLAQRDRRRPVRERVAAQVERLGAAQLALDLAARLLQVDDPDHQPIAGGEAQPSPRELHVQLSERLGRWYRMGEGWWEARIMWRPRIQVVRDPETKQATIGVVWYPFGPYYYRHWRQDGRQQTKYLGRDRPAGFPVEEDRELPEPEPIGEVGGWLPRRALWRSACRMSWMPLGRRLAARSGFSAYCGGRFGEHSAGCGPRCASARGEFLMKRGCHPLSQVTVCELSDTG
jgi:hypothetical protein